ncbi:MAG: hypothetical protein ABW134_16960 [Candidatus Thiodiazotropha endolucinida]
MKERANLWMPATYNDWWHAYSIYLNTLINETACWPSILRTDVCNTLLKAVEQQIRTPLCTDLCFQVLEDLVQDDAMLPESLNNFFWHWREYADNGKHPEITKKLRLIERRYTRRNLISRFNRYVLDVEWSEWDDESRTQRGKNRTRTIILVKALAYRIARCPEKFNEISHLISPEKSAQGLWYFGEYLAEKDVDRVHLPTLIDITLEKKHKTCLLGYLSEVMKKNADLYISTLERLLASEHSAWLGSTIVLSSDYDDSLFLKCLSALDMKWISPVQFELLRYQNQIEKVPKERLKSLFNQLKNHGSSDSMFLLIELFNSIPFDDCSPFDSKYIFDVISNTVPSDESQDTMRGYYWKNVCNKLGNV